MAKKKQDLTPEELLGQALVPESDWPYEVPENWTWTRLEYVAKWGSGGTPSRKCPEYYLGDIPWIKTGELLDSYIYDTEEKITEEAIAKSSARLFPVNTIVIAMYGATIGKVGIMGVESTTNQACACGISTPAINYQYLFYYALSQKDNFVEAGKGGAQPNISQKIIKRHLCPLPPIPEQQRIVDRIESLFAKLDQAKELIQEALDSFETSKAAVLHKAFTGELTKKWREENSVGMDSWVLTELGKKVKLIGGGTPSKSMANYWNGNIRWASVKDIKGDLLYDTIDRITEEGLKNSASNLAEIDDLILVTRISPGITTITKVAVAINQDLKIVTSDINNRYLHYHFMLLKDEIISKSSGSTVLGIRIENLNEIQIKVPPNSEQEEIANILDGFLKKEQQTQDLYDVINQIDLMKKAILARAFRGELGTNDPSEDSAIELLKEVLES